MIWSIVHTPEMQDGTTPIFRFYQEVIGKENIRLAVVDEDDRLDFVSKDDMVLVRTANRRLWKTIRSKMVRSTLEDQWAYELAEDKASLSGYLSDRGIRVPRQFGINDIVDGGTYFVKPRFGSDSKGISDLSVCRSKKDVARQIAMISEDFGQDAVIEEFVDGFDCTVSCWQDEGSVQTVAIGIECNGSGNDSVDKLVERGLVHRDKDIGRRDERAADGVCSQADAAVRGATAHLRAVRRQPRNLAIADKPGIGDNLACEEHALPAEASEHDLTIRIRRLSH